MGWFFRKSIKLGGGFRANISTRGIGISGGVKGARASLGPRGLNVYGGWGPFRYAKKIGGFASRRRAAAEGGIETNKGVTLVSLIVAPIRLLLLPVRLLTALVAVLSASSRAINTFASDVPGSLKRSSLATLRFVGGLAILCLIGLAILSWIGHWRASRAPSPRSPAPPKSYSEPVAVLAPSSRLLPVAYEDTGGMVVDPKPAEFRIWADLSGRHTVEARFSGMVGEAVRLTKRDGTTLELPVDRLSVGDQQWIKEQKR